jgi:hypothetical protein
VLLVMGLVTKTVCPCMDVFVTEQVDAWHDKL